MATRKEVELALEHLDRMHPAQFLRAITKSNDGMGAVIKYLSKVDAPVRSGEISDHLGVSTARMAVLLNKMSDKGLITRETDASDARVTNVRLSELGEKQAQKMRQNAYVLAERAVDKVGIQRLMEFCAISKEICELLPDSKFED